MEVLSDTITAQATPFGTGGVAVVRVSGPKTKYIIEQIIKKKLTTRYAHFNSFYDNSNKKIDEGLAIYFAAPNSFTGEDVLEMHCHGGQIIVSELIATCIAHGARMANPGEFTLRAYLNDKLSLCQAEAVSDLIHAKTHQAKKAALNSLSGEFNQYIKSFVEDLISLRVFTEAAIDFPDEEVDLLKDSDIENKLKKINMQLEQTLSATKNAVRITEGASIAIIGPPNAGKSSLLNYFAKDTHAIVTDTPGTTRDVIRTQVQLDGIPLELLDTAGIRETENDIERIGISRALVEIKKAELILFVFDASVTSITDIELLLPKYIKDNLKSLPIIFVVNKIDLISENTNSSLNESSIFDKPLVYTSIKNTKGLSSLEAKIKKSLGLHTTEEGKFSARLRHVKAIEQALTHTSNALEILQKNPSLDLICEELKCAQDALFVITGKVTSDDILGEIFSNFCIGK